MKFKSDVKINTYLNGKAFKPLFLFESALNEVLFNAFRKGLIYSFVTVMRVKTTLQSKGLLIINQLDGIDLVYILKYTK